MKWFQQLVHHDIWDYDIASAPVLIDVRRNGKVIPAVAQMTKMALMFIFNRETGEPIFGSKSGRCRRRPPRRMDVANAAVPDQAGPARTQLDDAGRPCEGHAPARGILSRACGRSINSGFGALSALAERTRHPGVSGRAGRRELARRGIQPLGLVTTNVMNAGQWGQLEAGGRAGAAVVGPAPAAAAEPAPPPPAAPPPDLHHRASPRPRRPVLENGQKRWSCSAPPWGELVAVNANTGDIAWRSVLGEFDELHRTRRTEDRHPQLGWRRSRPQATSSSSAPQSTATSARSTRGTAGNIARQAPCAFAGHADDVHGPRRQALRCHRRQRRRLLRRADRRRSHRVYGSVEPP